MHKKLAILLAIALCAALAGELSGVFRHREATLSGTVAPAYTFTQDGSYEVCWLSAHKFATEVLRNGRWLPASVDLPTGALSRASNAEAAAIEVDLNKDEEGAAARYLQLHPREYSNAASEDTPVVSIPDGSTANEYVPSGNGRRIAWVFSRTKLPHWVVSMRNLLHVRTRTADTADLEVWTSDVGGSHLTRLCVIGPEIHETVPLLRWLPGDLALSVIYTNHLYIVPVK